MPDLINYAEMTPAEARAARAAMWDRYGAPQTVSYGHGSDLYVYTFNGSKEAADEAVAGNRGYYGHRSWAEKRPGYGWCVVVDLSKRQ